MISEYIDKPIIEWVLITYFLAVNGTYFTLTLLALFQGMRYRNIWDRKFLPGMDTDHVPGITVLVPAYNEESIIKQTVTSLLNQDYPDCRIIVIDDGSEDRTLEVLSSAYDLEPFPEDYRPQVSTEKVHTVYRSRSHPELRVIAKENGEKADALNAGLNMAKTPLVCCMDADCVMNPDALRSLVQPFLQDENTVATGGTLRILNECNVRDGRVEEARVPSNPLSFVQIPEYLRAYLFFRLGWDRLNAVLQISGAFGLHHRKTVIEAGGYKKYAVAEDMEIVVRLHNCMLDQNRDYRIKFIPDPIVWTVVPDTYPSLKKQRVRWQRGITENLNSNRKLFLRSGSGARGWLAFPYLLFFEVIGAAIEVGGYAYMVPGLFFGYLSSPSVFGIFFLVAIGLGVLLSMFSLLLEEVLLHSYSRVRDIFYTSIAAFLENLGYRQLHSIWRFEGLIRWLWAGEGSYEEREKQKAYGKLQEPDSLPQEETTN